MAQFLRLGNTCYNYAFIDRVELRSGGAVALVFTDEPEEVFTGDTAQHLRDFFFDGVGADFVDHDDPSPSGDAWIEHLRKQRKQS